MDNKRKKLLEKIVDAAVIGAAVVTIGGLGYAVHKNKSSSTRPVPRQLPKEVVSALRDAGESNGAPSYDVSAALQLADIMRYGPEYVDRVLSKSSKKVPQAMKRLGETNGAPAYNLDVAVQAARMVEYGKDYWMYTKK